MKRGHGFDVYIVWAGALLLDPDTPAGAMARWMFRSGAVDGVRIMAKFVEYDNDPARYQRMTLEMVRIARSYGLKIMLSIDWHNVATRMNEYHLSRYFPRNVRNTVRKIMQDVEPDELEVSNEPFHIQSPTPDMTQEQYAGHVYEYIRGARDAEFNGTILGYQGPADTIGKSWIWRVGVNPNGHTEPGMTVEEWPWNKIGESKHHEPGVLHRLHTAAMVRDALESNPWAQANQPRGWQHWIWHSEMSPLGRGIHINSEEGAKAVTTALEFFKFQDTPFAFLEMGGWNEDWGNSSPGGWNMHTDLIDDQGRLSKGAKALLEFRGISKPWGPGDIPDPDPDPIPDPGDDMNFPGTKWAVRWVARTNELLKENNGDVHLAKNLALQDEEFQKAFEGHYKKWKQEADTR